MFLSYFLQDIDVSYLHVFTYSERANTPAATMPGAVPVEERRRRNQALRGLSEMKRRTFYAEHVGSARPVLFEHHKKTGLMSGFTDNYVKIEMPLEAELLNTIAPVYLKGLSEDGEGVRGVRDVRG